MGFSLVPCKSVIEPRLGQRLVGTVRRRRGVMGNWTAAWGWPEVNQADANNPTEWIPRNFLQPHRGQSTGGNRDADARRVLQGDSLRNSLITCSRVLPGPAASGVRIG